MANPRTLNLNDYHNVEDGSLDLTMINLTDDEFITQVIPYLKDHSEIITLVLSGNQLTDQSALALADAELNLYSLSLANNTIGVEGAKALATISSLHNLNLNYNKILDEGFSAFKDSKLQSLQATAADISNTGIASIVESRHLLELNVENNDINDEAAHLLKESTIQRVHLAGTKITASGYFALAERKEIVTLNPTAALPETASDALDTLTAAMFVHSEKNCGEIWQTLTAEKLRQLLLKGQDFQTSLQDQSLYIGDEKHAKGMLLGFLTLYMKTLAERTRQYNWPLIGWLVGKPSKDAKQPAANFYHDLLASARSLAQIDSELSSSQEHIASLTDTSLFGWVVSDLAALRQQISIVKEAAYREINEDKLQPKGP